MLTSIPGRPGRPLLPLLVVLLLLLLRATTTLAQAAPFNLGHVDPKDLTAGPFATDSAAAVVLFDYGVSHLEPNAGQQLQMIFEHQMRVKILKKSGFSWATFEVPLFGTNDKISGVRGFTHNLVNGVVTTDKLNREGEFTDDLTRHIRVRKFTLPNVREGSVIEFAYTVVSEDDPSIRSWKFQHPVPVRWSEYRAAYPAFFDYKMLLQGYYPLAVREQAEHSSAMGRTTVPGWSYRWAMQNLPAFVEEPFITTANDYVARLNFELSGTNTLGHGAGGISLTWEHFDQMLLESEDFGQQLARNGFLKDDVARLSVGTALPLRERVAAVHALVRAAVKYNEQDGVYATESLRKTYLERHRGSAADVNLLLIAALRAAGIEAQPVLLSTRDHGHLDLAFPRIAKFNYVLAQVLLPDGQDLLLDATDPVLPYDLLPLRCLGRTSRLVRKEPGQSRWLETAPTQRRGHFQQVQLTLTPQGALRGTMHEEYSGYAAATVRTELATLGEAKYRSRFLGMHSAWAVEKFAVGAVANLAQPLTLDCTFGQEAAAGATPAGPFYLGLLEDFGPVQNPFRQAIRLFPVDFGTAQDETLLLTLALPEGYELAETPKAAVVDLPDNGGRYRFAISSTGNTVQLSSRFSLRKPVYTAEEYTYLRDFYRLMLEKQAEKLVIRKKA